MLWESAYFAAIAASPGLSAVAVAVGDFGVADAAAVVGPVGGGVDGAASAGALGAAMVDPRTSEKRRTANLRLMVSMTTPSGTRGPPGSDEPLCPPSRECKSAGRSAPTRTGRNLGDG